MATTMESLFEKGQVGHILSVLLSFMPIEDRSLSAESARYILSSLITVLVQLRNGKHEKLSIDSIRHYLMNVQALSKLAIGHKGLTEAAVVGLRTSLATVGWDFKKTRDGREQSLQHSLFEQMYIPARSHILVTLWRFEKTYGVDFNL